MPPHASATVMRTWSSPLSALTSMVPSLGVCRIALSSRLRITRPNSSGSTCTGRSVALSPMRRTPFARATGSALASASSTRSPAATRSRCSRIGPSTRDSSNRSATICVTRSTSTRELPVVAADGLRVGRRRRPRATRPSRACRRAAYGGRGSCRRPADVGCAPSPQRPRRGAHQPPVRVVEGGCHDAQLAGRHRRRTVVLRVADLNRCIGELPSGAAQRSARAAARRPPR